MQIVHVKARNVKGVRYVEITPKKTTTIIGGKNGQGKSSLLDAIAMTLGGQKLCPPKPIKAGETDAECVVELDGDPSRMFPACTVTRKWWIDRKGNTKTELEIITKDGFSAPSPQAILNDVIGTLGFDPERFLSIKPAEQREILRSLVKLDFTDLDRQYKQIYEQRTNINRQGIEAKAKLDGTIKYDGVPDAEVSVSDLMDELKLRQKANDSRDNVAMQIAGHQEAANKSVAKSVTLLKEIDSLEERIRQLRKQSDECLAKKAESESQAKELTDQLLCMPVADVQEIEIKIKDSEGLNRKIRSNQERKQLSEKVESLRKQSGDLTNKIKDIEDAKLKLTKEAQWPVEGLGFDDSGVTFNGLPFDQISAKEKRQVAVSIGCAISPSLKFMFIQDGSLLDDDALIEVAELAATRGVQLFVERVGEGPECDLIISEGLVKNSASGEHGNE